MSEFRIKPVDESELDTILAEDIDFTGQLSFTKPLMIKGRFKGEIDASGDLASVQAQIDRVLGVYLRT